MFVSFETKPSAGNTLLRIIDQILLLRSDTTHNQLYIACLVFSNVFSWPVLVLNLKTTVFLSNKFFFFLVVALLFSTSFNFLFLLFPLASL